MDFLIYISLLEEAFHSHSRAEEEVEASVLGANVGNDELERIAQDLALVDLWMDPATASIPGSVAHLPWAGNQEPEGVRGSCPDSLTVHDRKRCDTGPVCATRRARTHSGKRVTDHDRRVQAKAVDK